MYGQGQGGVTATAAGVAALPNTGDNTVLTMVAVTAIIGGLVAIAMHLAISGYRRRVLSQ